MPIYKSTFLCSTHSIPLFSSDYMRISLLMDFQHYVKAFMHTRIMLHGDSLVTSGVEVEGLIFNKYEMRNELSRRVFTVIEYTYEST